MRPLVSLVKDVLLLLLPAVTLLFAIRSASAGPPLPIFHKSGVPQTQFAAEEIRAALKAKGQACTAKPLDEFSRALRQDCIAIAGTPEETQQLAAVMGVKPPWKAAAAQSYAIRKIIAGKQTTYAILGADPVGAMYGGLDLAEAIRLGTPPQATTVDWKRP